MENIFCTESITTHSSACVFSEIIKVLGLQFVMSLAEFSKVSAQHLYAIGREKATFEILCLVQVQLQHCPARALVR